MVFVTGCFLSFLFLIAECQINFVHTSLDQQLRLEFKTLVDLHPSLSQILIVFHSHCEQPSTTRGLLNKRP